MEENTNSVPLQALPRVSQGSHRSHDAEHIRDGLLSRASSLTAVHSVKTPDPPAPSHSFRIRCSFYGLFLAIVYAAFALSSWIITCYLSYRPTHGKSYRQTSKYDDAEKTHAMYAESERYFHAARVLQTITSVLSLPLTSGICATAAVIFMQRSRNLSLRQVMALADREWLPFAGNSRLIFGGAKYWSPFLFLAFALNFLALIIAPLQSILLSTDTIKTPTESETIDYLLNLNDPTSSWGYPVDDDGDDNLITVMARSALNIASRDELQPQMWAGANVSCNPLSDTYQEYSPSLSSSSGYVCGDGGATLANMPTLPDPFLAELPSGFNTGLIRQFAPRINSTAQYQNITVEEFPTDCQSIPNGFFVDYTNTTLLDYGLTETWGIQVCMPGDITQSPWQATRDRQDFSEVMYLNVSIDGYTPSYGVYKNSLSTFYKITLNTTAGYFELPNYMNGGVAGPLLEKDPSDICQSDCTAQGYRSSSIGYEYHHDRRQSQLSEPSETPYEVVNKGPLLTIALALFGEGSFITTRARTPSAYAQTILAEGEDEDDAYWVGSGVCIDTVPLGQLFSEYSPRGINSCISNRSGGKEGWGVGEQIAEWLGNFNNGDGTVANAFTAAAFLANQAWMRHHIASKTDRSLLVTYDLGTDTKVPSISLAGVVVVSVLLGVHVLSLLALGLYSAWSPRWTSTLDSFAMMRMGSDILPQLPMLLSKGAHRVEVLDQAPGYVGDAAQNERIGKLGVGAAGSLKKGRYFQAFHKDPETYDPYHPRRP
ncbi:hypothetical protein BDV06DRAFT_38288 [Aspergillus oleicola]